MILYEQARWGAIARLGLNDARRARELLEKAISDIGALDPSPEAVDAGWSDFTFAENDPVMADIIRLPDYHSLVE